MDERHITALRCPHPRCAGAGELRLEGRSLRCGLGHTHDIARQGYVDLLHGRDPGTGDDAAMVAARERVLGAGRFEAVTDAVGDALASHLPAEGIVLDLGTGTGHHLAGLLERFPSRIGLGLDLSRPALKRAGRCHPRAGAAVADVWTSLPVRDRVAAAVICVFAPRNASEVARVLTPDGVLVTVTPAPDHLASLVGPLGLLHVEPDKRDRLVDRLRPHLVPRTDPVPVRTTWRLDHAEVAAVVAMGPSADHLDRDRFAAAVAALPDPVEVTLAVEVRVFGCGPG